MSTQSILGVIVLLVGIVSVFRLTPKGGIVDANQALSAGSAWFINNLRTTMDGMGVPSENSIAGFKDVATFVIG